MGIVYRARHLELNRTEALKVMSSSGISRGAMAVQRFQIEAQAQARLDHPNVVPIYDMGEENGLYCISMRYIGGGNLAAHLENLNGDIDRSLTLLSRVGRAVGYAHRKQILHRDLKPQNILIDAQGTPYVSDFGLAKFLEETHGLTLTGEALGTPEYMAPEQIEGTANPTAAIDVFALGVMLYRLVTGRLPFIGGTPYETVMRILNEEPVSPRKINPLVGERLEAICLQCLEKRPEKRFQSGDCVAEALDECRPRSDAPPLQAPSKRFRIVIVEDHPIARKGIQAELEKLPTVVVVGEASNGREAVDLVALKKPDLILMDLSLPGLNGLEATMRITRDFPGMRVLVFSMHRNEEYFRQTLRAGAVGYVFKKATGAELRIAVERVLSGEMYLCREIADRLLRNFSERFKRRKSALDGLSDRQRDTLQLIAEGNTRDVVAQVMGVSPKTVQNDLARLMERLKAPDIPGLVRAAIKEGLIFED